MSLTQFQRHKIGLLYVVNLLKKKIHKKNVIKKSVIIAKFLQQCRWGKVSFWQRRKK